MKPFSRTDLEALLSSHAAPCVSIFLPLHRGHPEAEQDRIRLRNLLRQAAERLGELGFAREAPALLAPFDRIGTPELQQRRPESLAIFASGEWSSAFALPMPVTELVVVADSFHVRPLVRFVGLNRRFALLALSKERVALFEGSATSLVPLDLPGLASPSLREAVGVEEKQPIRQHPLAGSATGGGVSHPAAHGLEERFEDAEIARFFRMVDAAVWRALHAGEPPLILAGDRKHLPLYRELSRYGNWIDATIEGNQDHASPEQLHRKAWPLVEAEILGEQERLVQTYAAVRPRTLATSGIREIGVAAVMGRVRTLLVADGTHGWGRFDRETGALAIHDSQEPGDEDVLDDLAEEVLRRRGEVRFLPAARMPDGSFVAALLRW